MAKHPKHGDKDDDYEHEDQPVVTTEPAPASLWPAPAAPVTPATTEVRPAAGDAPLKGVAKGDPVRLLVAHSMAKHPKHGDKDDDYEHEDQPVVTTEPAPASLWPAPAAPVTPATTEVRPAAGDAPLKGVAKGDPVRLLVAHYDGFQRFEAGSVVHWWNDEPPTERNAALVDTPQTPLDAPPMTDGKPPEDYTDPATGKKPIIGSV